MSQKHKNKEQENEELQENAANQQEEAQEETTSAADTAQEEDKTAAELADMKDKYIRLMAEFENFRRRNAKERQELFKTASQDLMTDLLPVLDDMGRARQAIESSHNEESMLQGLELVFHKLKHVVQNKGLKEMSINAGEDFNSDLHEAVTQVPAPSDELKGKIIDVIEKGYTLNDKVIRFAKVIIGA